jgi:membrane protease YdiL (CAAX protease family)
MLFAVKNYFVPTLLLLALFVAAGIAAKEALGLTWRFDIYARDLLIGGTAMALSDAAIHFLLVWRGGARYQASYRAMVEYFRPQGTKEIIAGSLLAGGEEVIFRGVMIETLISLAALPPTAAVLTVAAVFGLLHLLPRRLLAPFFPWAICEGALLGGIYFMSGSILVVIILHILHDLAGFCLFAYQRRTEWLL